MISVLGTFQGLDLSSGVFYLCDFQQPLTLSEPQGSHLRNGLIVSTASGHCYCTALGDAILMDRNGSGNTRSCVK